MGLSRAAIITALVFAQVRGLQPGTGIVTGSIKSASGGAAASVRVGAVAIDDPSGTNLLSIAETDSSGRYRLTNIPEGRYYIVAGRVTSLTYYPGGTDVSKAREINVEPARVVSNVDFAVPADSKRPPASSASGNSVARIEVMDYLQAFAESNMDRRLNLFLSFEKNYPKSSMLSQADNAIAEIYRKRGDNAKAAEYTQKALKRDPDDVAALIQTSQDHARLGDLRTAIQHAQKAVTTVERMKAQPIPPERQSWMTTLEASARKNLDWVRQLAAQQDALLLSNIRKR